MLPVQPLRRFHLAEYSDIEDYRHYLALKVGTRTIEFPEGTQNFRCTVNYAPMQQLTLFAFGHRSDVIVKTPEEDVYRYQICRSGQVEITSGGQPIRLKPGGASMLTANTETSVRYSGGSEQIVLRASAAALKNKLQAMIGVRPTKDIAFDPSPNVETSSTSSLRALATQLIGELDANGTTNSIASVELEGLVTAMFLLGSRHNYSPLLAAKPKSSAPFQVRLAEEYIEANWDHPITIEMLTQVTGVSARSLFERFQSYRGVSPIAFLRHIRLQHARAMLMAPKPSTTVTGVALACGFLNTGHFARHYRATFGELPSKILAASRSLPVRLIGLYIGVTTHGWLSMKHQVVQGLSL